MTRISREAATLTTYAEAEALKRDALRRQGNGPIPGRGSPELISDAALLYCYDEDVIVTAGEVRRGGAFETLDLLSLMPAPGFVYLLEAVGSGRVKIGYGMDVERRVAGIQTSCPFDIRVIATCKGSPDLERRLHEHFKDLRLRGEWFDASIADKAAYLMRKWGAK